MADNKPSTREERDPIAKTPEEIVENDLANQKMGDSKLQGEDQEKIHNQRHDQAMSHQTDEKNA